MKEEEVVLAHGLRGYSPTRGRHVTALAYSHVSERQLVTSFKVAVRKQRGPGMTPKACPLETHSRYPSVSQVMEVADLKCV